MPEEAVRLVVNGQPVATWSCTPEALDALGAGLLHALGYIRTADDLLELRVEGTDGGGDSAAAFHTIIARVLPHRATAAREEAAHRREHDCGPRYLATCGRDRLPARDPAAPEPDPERFPDLFRDLFDRSASRRTTGGHHTAALSDGHRLLHLHEEVGRHNAVDKALGSGLLQGEALSLLGLVTTARISGQIAEKCARAGVAWIASRSVPTSLAVEIAGAARLPILARAASPGARLFRP